MKPPDMSTVRPLAEIEKAAILRAVRLARGRTTLAAKALGIGRMTLHRRLRSYGFNARAVYDAWVGLPRLRREEAKAKLRARRQSILDRQERALDALAASGGVGDQASRGRLAERMALAP